MMDIVKTGRRGGARPGAGRPAKGTRPPPCWRIDEPLGLDMRYTHDAVIGSHRLLVRMLETGKHWLNAERFRATINELKETGDGLGDPRSALRRRINSL